MDIALRPRPNATDNKEKNNSPLKGTVLPQKDNRRHHLHPLQGQMAAHMKESVSHQQMHTYLMVLYRLFDCIYHLLYILALQMHPAQRLNGFTGWHDRPAWIRQVRQRSSIQDDQPLGLPWPSNNGRNSTHKVHTLRHPG